MRSQIAVGRYKNASEVMRAGLRLLEQQTIEDAARLAVLRELAAESFGALDRGVGTALEGDQQLADFVRRVGSRAATRPARNPRDD